MFRIGGDRNQTDIRFAADGFLQITQMARQNRARTRAGRVNGNRPPKPSPRDPVTRSPGPSDVPGERMPAASNISLQRLRRRRRAEHFDRLALLTPLSGSSATEQTPPKHQPAKKKYPTGSAPRPHRIYASPGLASRFRSFIILASSFSRHRLGDDHQAPGSGAENMIDVKKSLLALGRFR